MADFGAHSSRMLDKGKGTQYIVYNWMRISNIIWTGI